MVKTPQIIRAERRKKLRKEYNNNQLIQFWRVIVFSSLSAVTGFTFIHNGWRLIEKEHILVKGTPNLTSQSIVIASGINFPAPLLSINPEELKQNLLKKLPIKSISIRRRILPPGLEIETEERKVIAFAQRKGPKGIEKGMLDEEGGWMPLHVASQTNPPEKDLFVEGWTSINRKELAFIIKNRENLGSPLRKIILNSNGEISLQTKTFHMIYLGSNPKNLAMQLKALYQLTKKLPNSFKAYGETTVDIRDPTKPELQMLNN